VIEFDFEQKIWMLIDGNGQKRSMNGTWLFLSEDFKIKDKMVFKANQTLF
jgi:hypothetical protein